MTLPNRSHLLLVGLLWSALILAAPPHVSAGTILGAPPYLGLNSGLVGWWTFDGKDVAGVTAYDRSGNANSGTLTNGPTKTIGKIGQALNFDGTDDYVQLPGPPSASLDSIGTTTMSVWIYPRRLSGDVANKVSAIFDK